MGNSPSLPEGLFVSWIFMTMQEEHLQCHGSLSASGTSLGSSLLSCQSWKPYAEMFTVILQSFTPLENAGQCCLRVEHQDTTPNSLQIQHKCFWGIGYFGCENVESSSCTQPIFCVSMFHCTSWFFWTIYFNQYTVQLFLIWWLCCFTLCVTCPISYF